MLTRFYTGLFFFLIVLLCSWNPAKAQASDSLPEQIQRNWAQPDCGNYDDVMVLSKYFALKTGENGMSLLPARLLHKENDYWVIDIGGQQQPVQLQNDGILSVGAGDEARSRRWSKTWDNLKLDQMDEYTGCEDTPKIVPRTMMRLMRYIDRVSEQCTISVTNECAGVLFKLTDADNNKKLTLSEIRRMADQALLLSALAQNDAVTNKQAAQLLKDKKKDIDAIAQQLMDECDKNKSNSIDYEELVKNFKAPDVPLIKDMLGKIGTLIPAFKMAALTLK